MMIRWDTERRGIIIDERIIRLTAIEYQLLFQIRCGQPVMYADLATAIYNCQLNNNIRIMLDKHVDRIRGKLRGSGMYVYCILHLGYLFVPEVDPIEDERRAPKKAQARGSAASAYFDV